MCVALFPYDAKHDDELSLKENDVITLLSTELPDKGWWKGQLNDKIGVFPDNFVKLITVGEEVQYRLFFSFSSSHHPNGNAQFCVDDKTEKTKLSENPE